MHRNKCGATLSGPNLEQNLSDSRSRQKKKFALKFRQRQNSVGLQPSVDLQNFDEPEPVRFCIVDLINIVNDVLFPQIGLDRR